MRIIIFFVILDDVRRDFSGVLFYEGAKYVRVLMTPGVLLQLCQVFYSCFNASQRRRELVSLYSANTLSAAMRLQRGSYSPYSLAWNVAAVPRTAALRAVILKGFANFAAIPKAVVRRRQFLYNARIIRFDANRKLAQEFGTTAQDECSPLYRRFVGSMDLF